MKRHLLRAVGALLALAGGAFMLWVGFEERATTRAVDNAGPCLPGQSDDCLRQVEGQVTRVLDHYRKGGRMRAVEFEGPQGWHQIEVREGVVFDSIEQGQWVRASYYEEYPIELVAAGGRVGTVDDPRYAWWRTLLAGVFFLICGLLLLVSVATPERPVRRRRRNKD